MQVTERTKGTFSPMHVKYSLALKMGSSSVNDFLKKSCMEFCGSLPGDDRGEDGYSLSGEARDAATSRNGLNENRKSVAEMIQECFDSIENNGDAI